MASLGSCNRMRTRDWTVIEATDMAQRRPGPDSGTRSRSHFPVGRADDPRRFRVTLPLRRFTRGGLRE